MMALTAMDKLLFWLGIGAAQKSAGSNKRTDSRHWVISLIAGIRSFCWSVNDEAYAAASLRLLKLKRWRWRGLRSFARAILAISGTGRITRRI